MAICSDTATCLQSLEAYDEFIASFQNASLPVTRWNHAAHLLMGLWYLQRDPPAAALDKVRAAIQAYNDAHGIEMTVNGKGGYHETMTRFWLILIWQFLQRHSGDLLQLASSLLSSLPDRKLIYHYYSRPCIWSERARASWVAPDLQSLEPQPFQ